MTTRYDICIDLPNTIKNPSKYLERKIKGSNVVCYFKVQLKKVYPQKVKRYET